MHTRVKYITCITSALFGPNPTTVRPDYYDCWLIQVTKVTNPHSPTLRLTPFLYTRRRLSTSAGFVPPNGDGSQGVLKNVPAWNTTFVTVLGKSRTVVQNVIDTLLASDLIPGDGDGNSMINKYGLSRQSGIKTNALLLRHAVPLDDAAWAQYADAPPFIVMRVTPRRPPLLPAPFPRATLIQRYALRVSQIRRRRPFDAAYGVRLDSTTTTMGARSTRLFAHCA
jgi:hypothetical protein